jgi:hypothetical protein
MAILQSLFFLDCDLSSAQRALDDALGVKPLDQRSAIMADILGFVLSENFVGS